MSEKTLVSSQNMLAGKTKLSTTTAAPESKLTAQKLDV